MSVPLIPFDVAKIMAYMKEIRCIQCDELFEKWNCGKMPHVVQCRSCHEKNGCLLHKEF